MRLPALPSRGRRPYAVASVAVIAVTVLAACGTEQSGPEPGQAPEGAWQTQQLDAQPGTDMSPVFVADGDDVLLLTVTDDGELISHLSADGADFERGTPLDVGVTYLQLGDAVRLGDGDWYAIGSGGLEGSGNDERMTFAAHAFRSDDGLSWEEVPLDGFDGPVDVGELAVVDDTLVLAGSYRTAKDPSMGGFEARAWTSGDGAHFTEVALPEVPTFKGYRSESYAARSLVLEDRLLVGGRVGGEAAVWATDDAGATWQRVGEGLDVYDLTSLVAVGDTVLAGVGESKHTAYVSTDAGDTWAPVAGLPNAPEGGGWAPVHAGGAGFWTLTGVDDDSWSRPEVCYADPDQCGQNPGPRLVTSVDGSEWTAVELDGSGVEVDAVIGTADGRTLALTGEGKGMAVHVLAAGTAAPRAADPVEPPTVELVTVPKGEKPEIGTRYHAPMYLHCGMTNYLFGEVWWGRTDGGADIETGAGDDSAPEGWPFHNGTLYGYATLTDADHLEYTNSDGDVIATYERTDEAFPCS